MRFIVDESTGYSVARFLQAEGHDVLIVAEAMPEADDVEILQCAVTEKRIVVTNDKDFGELIFRHQEAHQGVILLRLQDEGGHNKVNVFKALLAQFSEKLPGRFAVATERKVRFRSQPEKS
jgi:predicted nuclease of predicted toxin-antitoxin system